LKILDQNKTGNRVTINVEVDYKEYKESFDIVLTEASKSLRIPGFRPGKAPKNIIEQNINLEFVAEKTLDRVVEKNYMAILKESAVEPVDYPLWKLKELKDGVSCSFTVEVDVQPEVKLGKYKGLKVERVEKEVKESDIDEYVKYLCESASQVKEVTDQPVKLGNIAELDVEGCTDGVVMPALTQKKLPILIGDNRIAAGFDDNIVGLSIGETKEFNLVFPKDYFIPEFAEKEATFKVKVNKIAERQMPAFDDEYVQKISSFKTADEYRADIRKRFEASAKNEADSDFKNKVLEKLSEGCEVDIPESMVKRETDVVLDELSSSLSQKGLTVDGYIKNRKISMADLRKELEPGAKAREKAKLALRALAVKEKIEATEEDVENEIKEIAKEAGKNESDYKDNFGLREYVKDFIVRRKALDFVVDNSKTSK